METTIQQAERYLRNHIPPPEDMEIREVDGEIHLSRRDETFARLIPTEKKGVWRMEYFRNREEWELSDIQGSLEECLTFLTDQHHYLFWE